MYGAMVVLTSVMGSALAFQFLRWLWGISPRATLIVGGVGALAVGIYLVFHQGINRLIKRVKP